MPNAIIYICVKYTTNMEKKTNTKPTISPEGKNIRISSKSHALLLAFCKKRGYTLGAFCEIGALDKMKNESTPLNKLP